MKRKSAKKTVKRERSAEMPKDIPLLCRDDVCQPGKEREGSDKRSLDTWFELVFSRKRFKQSVRERFYSAVMDVVWQSYGYHGFHAPDADIADQAAIWNAAAQSLGYDVPGHLCIVLGSRKKKGEK